MKKRVLLLIMCVFAITAVNAQLNPVASVAIVGDGAGGWPGSAGNPGPSDLHQMTKVDVDNWILTDVTLTTAAVKFRANNSWADADPNWGVRKTDVPADKGWPSYVSLVNNDNEHGDNIPAVAGTYNIKLNTLTGAYSFEDVNGPPAVLKITGSAVVGGELIIPKTGADTYSIKTTFLDGTAKFDLDGILLSDSALTGVAFEGGSAFTLTAGTWLVTFNIGTYEYSIVTPPADAWSLTGAAIKDYTWGTDLALVTEDGVIYTSAAPITVIGGGNGFVFRIAGNWDSKKGAKTNTEGESFPSSNPSDTDPNAGTGTADIVVAAEESGDYTVVFNSLTGEYTFTNVLSTKGFSSLNFKVYPNPTTNNWNFTSTKERIESIQVLDVLGKNVMSVSPKNNNVNVDASSLTKGIYFAKVATATAIETLKLMKN